MTATPERELPGQPRALGFWMCLALVMGSMIGSGIFLLPVALAPLGWNAVYGWLVTIGGVMCMAMVFSRLAHTMPRAGGPYVYAAEAFGEMPGFMVAWSYWISVWSANATISIAAVSYLSTFAPGIAKIEGLPALLAIGFIWLFTAVNLLSVKLVGRVQVATTGLKLLPLGVVIVIVLGVLASSGGGALAPYRPADIGLAPITTAAALTLWAMVGFEAATIPAGKVKSPARTIPLSTVLGTALTGLLYLVVCSGMILLMPADAIAHSNAPFGVFVERFWAHGPANLVALFAAISALGALNGWVLVQGEMPLAMARDGAFPSWFAAVSARGTPVRALLVSSLLASLLVAANYSRSMSEMFIFMGLLSTAITLIVYFATMLAAIREYARGRFGRAPWVLVLAGIGTLYSLWAISGVGFGSAKWSFLLFVSGAPVYYLMRRSRAAQQTAE